MCHIGALCASDGDPRASLERRIQPSVERMSSHGLEANIAQSLAIGLAAPVLFFLPDHGVEESDLVAAAVRNLPSDVDLLSAGISQS